MTRFSYLSYRTALACLTVSLSVAAANLRAAEGAYSNTVTIKPLLKTAVDGTGRPLAYPTGAKPEVTAVHVEIPPGTQTNWHKHPVPCFAYMLEGELEIDLADGTKKIVKAGEAFAEVVDTLHNGVNRTKSPARLVMFALSVTDQPYAVRSPTGAPTPSSSGTSAPTSTTLPTPAPTNK